MRIRDHGDHQSRRFSGLITATRDLLAGRTWSALARLTLLSAMITFALPAEADEATANAPTAPAATSAPAAPDPNTPTTTFGPTAGPEWVDRLATARQRVRAANEASDVANGAYARALYEKVPAGPKLDALRSNRAQALQEYRDAMAAVPELVDEARADGVSSKVLDLYEQSMHR
jgi:hypothetical protein